MDEYLGAARGLGYLIAQAEGVFDTTGVFTGLVLLSIFVLLIDLIVNLVEKWFLKWKPEVSSVPSSNTIPFSINKNLHTAITLKEAKTGTLHFASSPERIKGRSERGQNL